MSSIERPEGLPSNWTIQFKGSDEEKRECYIDPESGREFHSMLEVSDYLNTLNTNKPTENTGDKPPSETVIPKNSEPADVAKDTSENKQETSEKSNEQNVTSGTQVEGLPPGWIKEVIARRVKGRIRKDSYYLDPSSDYAFLSKLDALRYLENGNIEKCAIKPRNKSDILMHKATNTPTKSTTTEKKSTKGSTDSKKSKKSTSTPPSGSSKRLKKSEEEKNEGGDGTKEEVKGEEAEVEKSTNDEKTEIPLVPEPSSVDSGVENVNGDSVENAEEVKGKEAEVEKSTNDEKTEIPLVTENVNGDGPVEGTEMPVEESGKNDDVIMKSEVSNEVTNF